MTAGDGRMGVVTVRLPGTNEYKRFQEDEGSLAVFPMRRSWGCTGGCTRPEDC